MLELKNSNFKMAAVFVVLSLVLFPPVPVQAYTTATDTTMTATDYLAPTTSTSSTTTVTTSPSTYPMAGQTAVISAPTTTTTTTATPVVAIYTTTAATATSPAMTTTSTSASTSTTPYDPYASASIPPWEPGDDAPGDGTTDPPLDSDGDGIPDILDPLPPGVPDMDGDTVPDAIDLDTDGDGVRNDRENALDLDEDLIPDHLDEDSYPPIDTDGDGDFDDVDDDADGDGTLNDDEDFDSNHDGLDDMYDPNEPNPIPIPAPGPMPSQPVPDEPEGCQGPAEDERCVTYAGDLKTITEHTVTILGSGINHRKTKTMDLTTHERWNYLTKQWVRDEGRTENIHIHTWAENWFDPFSGTIENQNTHRYTHSGYLGESPTPYWTNSSGEVNVVVTKDIAGKTYKVQDTQYTYQDPPLVRNGHESTWEYDNNGRLIAADLTDYRDGMETHRTSQDTNGDGTLDTCTVTRNGVQLYHGSCPAPDNLWA